jgi:hypothetical protein
MRKGPVTVRERYLLSAVTGNVDQELMLHRERLGSVDPGPDVRHEQM